MYAAICSDFELVQRREHQEGFSVLNLCFLLKLQVHTMYSVSP